ncbi:kanamycin nucleotidyltransferase C-terminal domain-containing protein [Fredinandcohnia humi]
MLTYPVPTTREEKFTIIHTLKEKLLISYGENIIAIGVYGSIGKKNEGAYSDIEMHVVTQNGFVLPDNEFIYLPFKVELDCNEKSVLIQKAKTVNEMWPIKAGSFIHIESLYDPTDFFSFLQTLPMQPTDEEFKAAIKKFMIWGPFESMGKIRNNWENGNHSYLPLGTIDFAWEIASLIGLANKQYFTTRAKTFEESLHMKVKPSGYEELVWHILEGKLEDKEKLYQICETLWTGLNNWCKELGIEYINQSLDV